MIMKLKIIEILLDEFNDVYCYNCRGNDDFDFVGCEDCHRKSIGWSLSERSAEDIADRIINTIFQIKEKDISKE